MKLFWIFVAVTVLNIAITVYLVVSGEVILSVINSFAAGASAGLAFAAYIKHRLEYA
jgi:hypothetical protein